MAAAKGFGVAPIDPNPKPKPPAAAVAGAGPSPGPCASKRFLKVLSAVETTVAEPKGCAGSLLSCPCPCPPRLCISFPDNRRLSWNSHQTSDNNHQTRINNQKKSDNNQKKSDSKGHLTYSRQQTADRRIYRHDKEAVNQGVLGSVSEGLLGCVLGVLSPTCDMKEDVLVMTEAVRWSCCISLSVW